MGSTDHLDRRQPQGPGAGEVLDQQGQEALEAAENGPVDHDRAVLGVVGPDVVQVEALRQLVVELNRGALPLAADGVGDVEVDLRAVERPVALVDGVALARRLQRPPQLGLGVVPRVDRRPGTPRAGSTASSGVLQPEVAVDPLDQAQQPLDLFANLRLHHEAVRVVLRELPDAGQAREHARRLVAVQRRLLVEADGAGRGSCASRSRRSACGRGSSWP